MFPHPYNDVDDGGSCLAIGTIEPCCSFTKVLGYNIFKRRGECVDLEDPSAPYYSSPEMDEVRRSLQWRQIFKKFARYIFRPIRSVFGKTKTANIPVNSRINWSCWTNAQCLSTRRSKWREFKMYKSSSVSKEQVLILNYRFYIKYIFQFQYSYKKKRHYGIKKCTSQMQRTNSTIW